MQVERYDSYDRSYKQLKVKEREIETGTKERVIEQDSANIYSKCK